VESVVAAEAPRVRRGEARARVWPERHPGRRIHGL